MDHGQRRMFEQLYDDNVRVVHAYAARRVDASMADDIVAETFLTAWRRIEDLPAQELHLAWLLGIARGQVANNRRGHRRRSALLERISAEPPPFEGVPQSGLDPVLHAALGRLGDTDRELLCLLAWERLDREAARRVLNLSAIGLRVRLHRARKQVRSYLEQQAPSDGPKKESTGKALKAGGRP